MARRRSVLLAVWAGGLCGGRLERSNTKNDDKKKQGKATR